MKPADQNTCAIATQLCNYTDLSAFTADTCALCGPQRAPCTIPGAWCPFDAANRLCCRAQALSHLALDALQMGSTLAILWACLRRHRQQARLCLRLHHARHPVCVLSRTLRQQTCITALSPLATTSASHGSSLSCSRGRTAGSAWRCGRPRSGCCPPHWPAFCSQPSTR